MSCAWLARILRLLASGARLARSSQPLPMKCPQLVDGPRPFCNALGENLLAGIHDVPRCRSIFWTECRAVHVASRPASLDPRPGSKRADLVVQPCPK